MVSEKQWNPWVCLTPILQFNAKDFWKALNFIHASKPFVELTVIVLNMFQFAYVKENHHDNIRRIGPWQETHDCPQKIIFHLHDRQLSQLLLNLAYINATICLLYNLQWEIFLEII